LKGRSRGIGGLAARFVVQGVLIGGVAVAAAQPLSRADADRADAKLAFIIETGESRRGHGAGPVLTSVTDRELNAYFEVYGPTVLPEGIVDPRVGIGDGGRVAARGTVDLGAVRRSRERDWLDPLAYVTGSLEVTATGVLNGSNRTGVFQFESATVGGVAVPKSVLQELVRYYTATGERPNGVDLDAPFELPANIRSVTFERGRATIVQ